MSNETIGHDEYREVVRRMAQTAIDAEEDEGMHLSDSVWEQVDSCRWIMIYRFNTRVLDLAKNDPDEWRPYVSDDASWKEVIQAMAFKAMELDVWEATQELKENSDE